MNRRHRTCRRAGRAFVRLYLIEPDDLVAFCNEVNQGFEPRYQIHGRFLLRQGDETVSVGDARPELPESHRGYLLDNPIEARVIQVLATKPVASGVAGIEQGVTTVVLDARSRDGVRVGMELVCHEPVLPRAYEQRLWTKVPLRGAVTFGAVGSGVTVSAAPGVVSVVPVQVVEPTRTS